MATIPTTFRDMEQAQFNKVMEELKHEPKYLIAMGNAANTVSEMGWGAMHCLTLLADRKALFTGIYPEDLEKMVSWKDRVRDDNITGVLAELQEEPALLDFATSFVLDLLKVNPEGRKVFTSQHVSLFRKNISDNISFQMAAGVLMKYTAQAMTDEDVKKAGEELEEAAEKAALEELKKEKAEVNAAATGDTPMAAAPAAASAPADLVALLAQAGLAEYTDAFVADGYDDVKYLKDCAEEDKLDDVKYCDLGLNAAQLAALRAALTAPAAAAAADDDDDDEDYGSVEEVD